ncbi:MAG: hypothetical protein ACOYKM_02000 [Caulobacterales bacterium]
MQFLLQKNGWSNALGLTDLQPPLEPRLRNVGHCPHAIDLTRPPLKELPDWADHPFVKAFAPTPREGKVHAVLNRGGEHDTLIYRLTNLSSPVEPLIFPIWSVNPRVLVEQLNTTNVSPLILCGVEVQHLNWVIRLLSTPSQRRLILICSARLPAERDVINIDPDGLSVPEHAPMALIGATLLTRWMRGHASP